MGNVVEGRLVRKVAIAATVGRVWEEHDWMNTGLFATLWKLSWM